ncbi:MAG: dihydropteroate synthase [Paludibacteraceae bacterium]|nr:dihydropteroate synthase [Paludibacteraceae bacterium]
MPQILGIVNITADSFSDGGQFLQTEAAVSHASSLISDGADMLDLGAASSNIHSSPVSEKEEIRRLDDVLDSLRREHPSVPVSVDTFKPAVQRHCLRKGIDCLNDIQGFPFPELYPVLSDSSARLIVMHSVQRMGIATEIQTDPIQVFDGILRFFEQRILSLTQAGIDEQRIIIDPGMGHFLGSNPESSLYVLQHIQDLKNHFHLPVLIAVSRKSFLARISHCDADLSIPIARRRAAATLAAELFAARNGADIIRTHDVQALRTALQTEQTIQSFFL